MDKIVQGIDNSIIASVESQSAIHQSLVRELSVEVTIQ